MSNAQNVVQDRPVSPPAWKLVVKALVSVGLLAVLLSKSDPARRDTVLYVTIETIRQVAILTQPVMPQSMARLLDLLAVPAEARNFASLGETGRLTSGTALPAPSAVFPRYVEPEQAAST